MSDIQRLADACAHVGVRWRRENGSLERVERDLAEETAIGLAYDSRPYVVLMASPVDLDDLARGFTITERIAPAAEIVRITALRTAEGLLVDILLTPRASAAAAAARRRAVEARSSCGLCGVEMLADAVRPPAKVGEGPLVRRSEIQRAVGSLAEHQDLGRRTRATHAAAWADLAGGEMLVREDVGRHNALDKVVGAAARARRDGARAIVVVTSRCSYEMVDKTAAAGAAILVAISAPTALAIRHAELAGLTLVALARADGHVVFTRPDRITEG